MADIISGTTKSGIEFEIDKGIFDDIRVVRSLSKITSERAHERPMESASAIFDLCKVIFGSDEGVDAFIERIAESNDGRCDTATFMRELKEILEVANTKN